MAEILLPTDRWRHNLRICYTCFHDQHLISNSIIVFFFEFLDIFFFDQKFQINQIQCPHMN